MSRSLRIALVLIAFFLLRDDFWLADNPAIVLGLPVGLLYHAGYCVAAALLMAWLVRVVPPFAPRAERRERREHRS